MARSEFILTHRHGNDEARDAMHDHLQSFQADADIQHDSHAGENRRHRRSVRLTADHDLMLGHRKSLHEHVVLEPRVFFQPHSLCHIGGGRHVNPEPAPPADKSMTVTVVGGGMPLPRAGVSLMYQDGQGTTRMMPQQDTDANGQVTIHYGKDCKPIVVGAYPFCGFWSACVTSPGDQVELDCKPLPAEGPLAWWHEVMGVRSYNETAGQGIRVGVIGTGVSAHPNLTHVDRVDGKDDLTSHGTHVCGLIAARPTKPGDYAGFAPGATVLAQRVFELEHGKVTLPDQATLADAIEDFAGLHPDREHRVDLINMSLGGPTHSQAVHNAIQDAMNQGTLCLCSAGNSSSAVEFPAAFPETIAVSGLGRTEWGPPNSITVFMSPPQEDRYGEDDLFLASFSCYGRQITCASPGDGLISTVPASSEHPDPYAVMDGTSLSSPAACGILASVLSDSAEYRDLPYDSTRSDFARRALRQYCEDVGMDPQFEGSGMPVRPESPSPIRARKAEKRSSSRR